MANLADQVRGCKNTESISEIIKKVYANYIKNLPDKAYKLPLQKLYKRSRQHRENIEGHKI
jgi:hypothetical protein